MSRKFLFAKVYTPKVFEILLRDIRLFAQLTIEILNMNTMVLSWISYFGSIWSVRNLYHYFTLFSLAFWITAWRLSFICREFSLHFLISLVAAGWRSTSWHHKRCRCSFRNVMGDIVYSILVYLGNKHVPNGLIERMVWFKVEENQQHVE